MTEREIGLLILTLGIFVGAVHGLGYFFEKMRQPRLVGEILAGILLGPFVLGKVWPWGFHILYGETGTGTGKTATVLSFVYWLGVILLMFISGSQVKKLLAKENRKQTAWIVGVGTPLPFFIVLGLCTASYIPVEPLIGVKDARMSAILVLACAVAVTSIPVLSRIFNDLGILHTRFASLILGCAVLEDIGLWAVLALASALAKSTSLSDQNLLGATATHISITLAYMGLALTMMPRFLRKLRQTKYNVIFRSSPLAYAIFVLFGYVGLAAYLGVNLVFAAFLAGFGLAGGIAGAQRQFFTDALDAIYKFSYSVFIPIYFGLVGYRLVLGRDFSWGMLAAFLIGSSIVALLSRALASHLAGFRGMDRINIAITSNARGGPGIVMASVAYEAGIISASFYTTLVVTAIITSQAAGLWLRNLLAKGQPLLAGDTDTPGAGDKPMEGLRAIPHGGAPA